MRFSEVLAASLVAPLVVAHGGIQGAPKLFGLPSNVKIRNPTPRAARAAAAAQGPHLLHARQGGDANNRCGPSFGNAVCADGYCCSGAGYCGNTPDHCNAPDCLFNFGPGCDANKTPAGASTRNDARPQKGSVQYGGAGIYSCLKPGTVAITYDDGPYIYTDEVLNKFAAAGFKATFFVTGINIGKGAIDEQWSTVIKRMYDEGHQVASHTWSHQDLSQITEAQVYDQMVKNEMAIRNIIGKYPTYMRPPYSSCTGTCQNVLKNLGYVVSYFDLDTDDYNQLTAEKIQVAKDNFVGNLSTVQPDTGSKLAIAHDIHELTALNLTVTIIETLQARGFKGVTMGECMNEPEANWYRDSTPGTPNPSPTSASSSTGPTPTPTGAVSTDGTCGGTNGYTCIGFTLDGAKAECCSQYGYCGASTDYCGTGCNTLFGSCGTNANPSSSSASSSTAPQPTGALKTSTDGSCGASSGFTCVGFTLDGAKAECCSQYGYCGGSTDYCGTGCNPLAGNCGSVSSSVSSSVAHSSSAPVSSDMHDSTSSAVPTSSITTSSASTIAVPSSSASPSVSTDKSGDESSTVPTKPSQTSSVYADDYSTATSSSAESLVASSTGTSLVASSTGDYNGSSTTNDSAASSTTDHPASSTTSDYPTTLASSVRTASSTPCTTSSTPTPTPTKSVSKDGKCGGENGQTCAGYKNSFGFKLECCCKQTGRCSADPWACGLGCDKKSGKCWH